MEPWGLIGAVRLFGLVAFSGIVASMSIASP